MKTFIIALLTIIVIIILLIDRSHIKAKCNRKFALKTLIDPDTLTDNITKEIDEVYLCSEALFGHFCTEHFIHWSIILKIKNDDDYYAISTSRYGYLIFDRVIPKNGKYFEYCKNKYGRLPVKIIKKNECIINITLTQLLKRYVQYMKSKGYYNMFTNNCQHIASYMYKLLTGIDVDTISGFNLAKMCAKEYLIGPNTI